MDDHTVVTSYQSVAKAAAVAVVNADGSPSHASLGAADPASGIALLEVDTPSQTPLPASVADQQPSVGGWVATAGYPARSGTLAVQPAQVRQLGQSARDHGVTLTNLGSLPGELDRGLAGAPVIDAGGHIVGLLIELDGQNSRLFVPASRLRAGLATARKAAPAGAGNCSRPVGPQESTVVTGSAPSAIRTVLTNYFSAINEADYDAMFNTMTSQLSGNRDNSGWVSTFDFNIHVHTASNSGGRARAWVTFDSLFRPENGPKNSTGCARWSLNYSFDRGSNGLVVAKTTAHSGQVGHADC